MNEKIEQLYIEAINENLPPNVFANEVLGLFGVSYSCVCCDVAIKKIDGLTKDKDYEGMWNGGIVEKISAGYGSLLDGNMYVLAICDKCVKSKKLKCVGNYMFPDNCA